MATATSKKADKKPAAPKATGKAAPAKAKAAAAVNTKAAAKPAAKPKAARPTGAKAGASTRRPVGEEQRRNYIEVAAYYIAERRGFNGGDALEDWATAEAEIDRLLAEGRLNP